MKLVQRLIWPPIYHIGYIDINDSGGYNRT